MLDIDVFLCWDQRMNEIITAEIYFPIFILQVGTEIETRGEIFRNYLC